MLMFILDVIIFIGDIGKILVIIAALGLIFWVLISSVCNLTQDLLASLEDSKDTHNPAGD